MLETIAIVIGYVVIGVACVAIIGGVILASFAVAVLIRRMLQTNRIYKRLEYNVSLNTIKGVWTAVQVLKQYGMSNYTVDGIEATLKDYRDRCNIDREELRKILNAIKIHET